MPEFKVSQELDGQLHCGYLECTYVYAMMIIQAIKSFILFYSIHTENQLLKDIEDARMARQDLEKGREDLVKKAKSMQHKTTNRRNEGLCFSFFHNSL